MSNTNSHNEFYELIGNFMAKVNSIEFLINILLEKILVEYSNILNIQQATDDTIDHVEEQSLRVRINFIIVMLAMTNSDKKLVEDAIQYLQTLSKYYNKNVRHIRDFIAHNPYVTGGESVVLSSRRYKGKLNSIKKEELKNIVEELTPQIRELHSIVSNLSTFYPAELKREIN